MLLTLLFLSLLFCDLSLVGVLRRLGRAINNRRCCCSDSSSKLGFRKLCLLGSLVDVLTRLGCRGVGFWLDVGCCFDGAFLIDCQGKVE
jgi:hypothetical protein